ncbi:hypothetical protein TNIN_329661 [Trichonephila inaurata madagascariensis]|uniref:Uncharacterized protein n=1 Tax=Trichonephila inaurata madagascariensis TaxID=2747483 RepID=A0A8X6YT26_9ARAC|nr:hypothetical protein TNIN_329661 [Trichonephila inaurata madagascariensis]
MQWGVLLEERFRGIGPCLWLWHHNVEPKYLEPPTIPLNDRTPDTIAGYANPTVTPELFNIIVITEWGFSSA